MSKTISREQAIQGLMTLGTKVDWDKVDGDIFQQMIVDQDKQTGPQFTAFLQNGGKVVIGEPRIVKINRSLPFDPVKFIDKGWTIDEQDERSIVLTEVDLTKVCFVNMLKSGEVSVQGEEKLKRLKQDGRVRPDAKLFQMFWHNQYLIPASWKEKIDGKTRYIFFDGTVLRGSGGGRCVLCLCWFAGVWSWDYGWLDSSWGADYLSAVLTTV